MNSIRRCIPLLFCLIILSGCGFHLRGLVDLPAWLNRVAVITPTDNHDLGPLLRDQLQAYHIEVLEPTAATYWLIIENATFQQQITSISSSTTPRQYQLIYTVWFKLQSSHGKIRIPSTTVVVTRQITINSDRILGSDEEEAITKNEMKRDAMMQILNRLSRKA